MRNLVTDSWLAGVRGVRRRPGLVVLLFLPAFVIAAAISAPLYVVLNSATASSGFGHDMIERFDMILVTEASQKARDGILAVAALIPWMVPVVLLWKVVFSVGLINAIRSGGVRSFWEGVGRFSGSAILVTLINLAVFAVWVLATIVVAGSVASILPIGTGPQVPAAIGIILCGIGAALVGLMQDFAKISLVCDGKGVLAAWQCGIRYAGRHPQSLGLYGIWWACALVVSVLLVETHVSGGSTLGQIWTLFAVQQLLLFLRSGVTVAWLGGAVAMHERLRFQEAPLLAVAGVSQANQETQPPPP